MESWREGPPRCWQCNSERRDSLNYQEVKVLHFFVVTLRDSFEKSVLAAEESASAVVDVVASNVIAVVAAVAGVAVVLEPDSKQKACVCLCAHTLPC